LPGDDLLQDARQALPGPGPPVPAGLDRQGLGPQLEQEVLEGAVVAEVPLHLPPLDLVERRLRDEQVPRVHDLAEVPEEEGEQEGADVLAVHVGVRHDDDPVVAQLLKVEFRLDAGPEGGDQHPDLLRREHPVCPCPLGVQDLAP